MARNEESTFRPGDCTPEKWAVFEKSVRSIAHDPNLDVAKLYGVQKPIAEIIQEEQKERA